MVLLFSLLKTIHETTRNSAKVQLQFSLWRQQQTQIEPPPLPQNNLVGPESIRASWPTLPTLQELLFRHDAAIQSQRDKG